MIQLSAEEAELELRDMVQADQEPTLTDEQVTRLLNFAKRADVAGAAPSDDGWLPTWDLNAAAAEGWLRKAGMVSPRFDTNTDGSTLSRAQLFSHCMKQHETYASKLAGYIRRSPDPDAVDADGIIN